MKTQIPEWGNSMAVRVPKAVAEAASLELGDYLELVAESAGTVRIPKQKGKAKLAQLVREISNQNLHNETDWGAPMCGKFGS
jgi:antitoxin MazE